MTPTSQRAVLLIWLRRTGAGLTLLLLLTGAYLTWGYRPVSVAPWESRDASPDGLFWSQRVWQITHLISAILLPVVLVATIVVTALQQNKFRLGPISPPILVLLGAGAASVSGVFLPWDQLALWAATTDSDLKGFRVLWSDEVRFVLVGGTILEPQVVQRALIAHIALGIAVTGSTIALASFGRTRNAGIDEL